MPAFEAGSHVSITLGYWPPCSNINAAFDVICDFHLFGCMDGVPGWPLTWCSNDVRLMKRRKSSPPEDTATEESTPVRQSVAPVRLSLKPRIVSPEGAGTACQHSCGSLGTQEISP